MTSTSVVIGQICRSKECHQKIAL